MMLQYAKLHHKNLCNKPIQDGGEAKAPLWLNRVGPAKWD